MDFLKMIKDMSSMKKKAKDMEKELRNQKFEVSISGVSIIANAKQEILDIKITPQLYAEGPKEIEKNLLKGLKEVSNKSQIIMASETKKIMGDLNIPGLKNTLGL